MPNLTHADVDRLILKVRRRQDMNRIISDHMQQTRRRARGFALAVHIIDRLDEEETE